MMKFLGLPPSTTHTAPHSTSAANRQLILTTTIVIAILDFCLYKTPNRHGWTGVNPEQGTER